MSCQRLSDGWRLARDSQNEGREHAWFERVRAEAQPAPVPGIVQQVFPDTYGVFWYYHEFTPAAPTVSDQRFLLRFGAVDYMAEVWINGQPVGSHEGGETPFTLDVTSAIKAGVANLLAVRVLNPGNERIDGVILAETPHRNKVVPFAVGSSYNYGGILLPVELLTVPSVRVADVFVEPDAKTGSVQLHVTVRNDGVAAVRAELFGLVSSQLWSDTTAAGTMTDSFPSGESKHRLVLRVPQPHLWSTDDPYLYRATVRLTESAGKAPAQHETSVRFGFRDFTVKNGWFHLNGKRLFLRSTHTGNHVPVGQVVPGKLDFLRRDLVYAKACGYNCVRFISGVAWPDQLDLCDELGLLVYEENLAGWCLGINVNGSRFADAPDLARRFDLSTREMILRDRNHPSVAIWGLLNETFDGPVFRHAVEALPLIRDLDPTRLVLLHSGRWDGQWNIGSVCNPGSRTWEHVWGVEEADTVPVKVKLSWSPGGYAENAGDAHAYPLTPQPAAMGAFIRNLGQGTKPVFLSEYGIGSLMNVIDESRKYAEAGFSMESPDAVFIKSMADRLQADWGRLGLDGVYPFPEDMLRDSQRLSMRQRRMGFDLIRSNPNLCGYNLTGMLDHALTGEGMWTFWREWKPGCADVLRDGWAPLRWCLFVNPLHGYAGRPLRVEAVLANEDVLPAGAYSATFRILGPRGIAWEKTVSFRIAAPVAGREALLSVPVLNEEIVLDGPAGSYEFAARLDKGGCPAGDRMKFRLSDAQDLPKVSATVTAWGLDARAVQWLAAHGVQCVPWDDPVHQKNRVIVVGRPADSGEAEWVALRDEVARGRTAVFLQPKVFALGDDSTHWLPLEKKGVCKTFGDWLYHKDCVAKRHAIFEGLQTGAILDWDYYDQLIGHEIFQGQDTPEETVVAAFAAGYCCPGGYDCGVMVGRYKLGAGWLVLNTLSILEQLDQHPAADRLLLNIVRYAEELK